MTPVSLPAAKASPRVENGALLFYEGDTFRLILSLELYDADGLPNLPAQDSTLTLEIFDGRGEPVAQKTWYQTPPQNQPDAPRIEASAVTLEVDAALSALLPAGAYSWAARYNGAFGTTVAAANRIVVEKRRDVR